MSVPAPINAPGRGGLRYDQHTPHVPLLFLCAVPAIVEHVRALGLFATVAVDARERVRAARRCDAVTIVVIGNGESPDRAILGQFANHVTWAHVDDVRSAKTCRELVALAMATDPAKREGGGG